MFMVTIKLIERCFVLPNDHFLKEKCMARILYYGAIKGKDGVNVVRAGGVPRGVSQTDKLAIRQRMIRQRN